MDIDLLHRFTSGPSVFLNACLITKETDRLGVFYKYAPPSAPQHTYLASLTVLDIQRHMPSTITFNEHGPQNEPLADALLCYDVAQKRWIIAERLSWEYILLRTITTGDTNDLILSPACLFDRDQFSDTGFPPLLDLECSQERYRLLYHKPSEEEHRTAAVVTTRDFACLPAWSRLKEQVSILQAQNANSFNWQQWLELSQQPILPTTFHVVDKLLLPEQVLVDPGTTYASQTSDLEIIHQAEIAEAENAMTIAHQQTRLLVLCCPENWVWPNEGTRSEEEIEQTGEQWRIWLTGWNRSDLVYKWTYSPEIGLPTDPDVPDYEIPKSPDVEIAAIAGPETREGQPTFVATMAMQGTEEPLSHGVCLTHEGQVVQVCKNALGLAPSLCLCQQTVVGVDRLNGAWRLWNWLVLDETNLHSTLPLDATCQRAYVRSQPLAERFWLIEELPSGVQVSLRDANTLHEVQPAELIADTRLPEGQPDRPLEPQRNVGLIPYNDSLLLLLLGKEGELLLYQAQ